MGSWYSVGVFVGLGVALGIAAAAGLGGRRASLMAPFVAAAAGVVLGIVLGDAEEAAAGGVGGLLGGAGTLELVGGALPPGGPRNAIALPAPPRARVVAALAFLPRLGDGEAVVV